MVEEMLAARGICVTYETVRQWRSNAISRQLNHTVCSAPRR